MISSKWFRVVGATAALTFVLAACGGDDNGDTTDDTENTSSSEEDNSDGGSGDEVSGSVRVDGSSTVFPLSSAAADLFMQSSPGVEVSVASSGTGGGFEKFCNGETDISDASRPISDDEIAACEGNDVAFEQLVVANDALSVLVHPDNPVDCLTVEQLNAIWGPDSTISNWNEIPDLDVDFDQPLDLYGPGTDSGTFDYFTDAINGEEGAQRTDYNNIGEDDNTGLVGVQGSVGGMFYVGYSYYALNQDTVKALAIDGGNGCVEPSDTTAQDGSYTPLARGLFIYPSDVALERPEVQAFVQYYIDNNDEIATAADAIPMTDEQKETAREQVATLMGG